MAGRPLIMGIVNVTPDSFSDGGRWFGSAAAIEHGVELSAAGADIIDVGGESTRPGAARPSAAEERDRVVPVITELSRSGHRVSIDTMRAEVARAAVEAGAEMINDVSGGLADPAMGRVAAETGVTFIAMHWRGHSAQMQTLTQYDDIVRDVCRELSESVEKLVDAGVAREKLVVDPGFGFSKTAEQNWELLGRMAEFDVEGLPVLWGTSRKSFLGRPGRRPTATELVPAAERDAATAATSVLAAQHGAWGVRVHDVPSTAAALDVVLLAALGAGRATR